MMLKKLKFQLKKYVHEHCYKMMLQNFDEWKVVNQNYSVHNNSFAIFILNAPILNFNLKSFFGISL